MPISGVAKPIYPGSMTAADLQFDRLTASMAGDYAFLARGTLSAADLATLTNSLGWDRALAAYFDPLAELAEKPGSIESKIAKLRTRNFLVPGRRDNRVEINLVGISNYLKRWMESPDFNRTTLTLVLRTRDKSRILLFNGLRWIMGWSGEVDGLLNVVLSTEFSGATSSRFQAASVPITGIQINGDLIAFTTVQTGGSTAQFYQLANLTPYPVVIAAPFGFQVSTDAVTWTSGLTLPAGWTGTIYVRLNIMVPGTYAGDITHTAGATTLNQGATGTVAPINTINYSTPGFLSVTDEIAMVWH